MLQNLKIYNYALIDELNIDFTDGLTVITGETGSGKSILLGALSLLLGKRADNQSLLDQTKKCIVEAVFLVKNYGLETFFVEHDLDYEDAVIIRREINQQGNSRAFINDTPVNLTILREFTRQLIDIHSQHQTLMLNHADFQMEVLDSFALQHPLVKQFKKEFSEYKLLENELNNLLEKEKKSKAENDYLNFQFNELESSNLIEGELEENEKELEMLVHAEEIKKNFFLVSGLMLNDEINLASQLKEVKNLLQKFIPFHEKIKELYERIESCSIELIDIAKETELFEENISFDPERMQLLNERRDVLYRLLQKHQVTTIEELIKLKEDFSNKIADITSLDEKIISVKKEMSVKLDKLNKTAEKISDNRKKVISEIEKEIAILLSQLGMPDGKIKINHEKKNVLTSSGFDQVVFLFSANKGHEPRELSKIASGGELSRLMLCIKSLIAERNLLPTIIFDEIDMGVSGKIANMIGVILQKMSKRMQLIVITHLPQIAGKGDVHFLVYKKTGDEMTRSLIKKLNNDQRVDEISKMLSGNKASEAAEQAARELLK